MSVYYERTLFRGVLTIHLINIIFWRPYNKLGCCAVIPLSLGVEGLHSGSSPSKTLSKLPDPTSQYWNTTLVIYWYTMGSTSHLIFSIIVSTRSFHLGWSHYRTYESHVMMKISCLFVKKLAVSSAIFETRAIWCENSYHITPVGWLPYLLNTNRTLCFTTFIAEYNIRISWWFCILCVVDIHI